MRTVTLARVVDDVLAQAGMLLATMANPDATQAQVVRSINRRLREAWEFENWPELCAAEQRWYRPIWDAAATYAGGAELYYGSDIVAGEDPASGAGYFTPNTTALPAAAQSPATHPTKWLRIENLRRFVALDQPGKTEIGEVFQVTRRDPRLFPTGAGRLGYSLSAEGIVIHPEAGNSVSVNFRSRPTVFVSADYANPAKVLPYVLTPFVTGAAYADLMAADGVYDAAGRAKADAYQQLYTAVDNVTTVQGQSTSASVATY